MIRNTRRYLNEVFLCSRILNLALSRSVNSASDINFTKNKYDVLRGNYNTLEENHIHFFQNLLGHSRVLTDLSDLEKYNVDYFKHLRGNSRIVLKPKTTREVSQILSFCNYHRLAVCPQGGNTSVVGGSVPVFDEIIISTALMNEIISLDETSGILICQAGCILEHLEKHLEPKNLMMPLDLGGKGSCHIGGNISTNAGGIRLLRYGNLHGNVLGLEAVKANGEIIDLLSTLKKDNTGYHLKHLFIGSEGTLGFVTKVAIHCPTKPKSVNLVFLGLQNFEKVKSTFKKAKEKLSEIISAVEVMDYESMQMVEEHLGLKSPIGKYPFYLLIETSGSNPQHDEEKLNQFLDYSLSKHLVLNGTVAENLKKYEEIWNLREKIADCFVKDGFVFNYDISLPLKNYYDLVSDVKKFMGDKAHRVAGFGHLGDGNIHLTISVEKFTKAMKNYIEPYLFRKVLELNGSISAEHGMGFLKADYLKMVHGNSSVKLMKEIKTIMDPNWILNPYKVIPINSNVN